MPIDKPLPFPNLECRAPAFGLGVGDGSLIIRRF
jgi:hypothetical protein